MNGIKIISCFLVLTLLYGCSSTACVDGPKGPKLISSGRATETGQYAEVGVQFSTVGDFFSVFSPERWRNPVETGGSLSWINPVAWNDDARRTGRILLGEAVLVGGVALAYVGFVESEALFFGEMGGTSGPTAPPSGGGGPPPAPPGG